MNLNQIFKPCYEWLQKSVPVLSPYGAYALKQLLSQAWPEPGFLKKEFNRLDRTLEVLNSDPSLFDRFAVILSELRDISGTLKSLEQQQTLDEVEIFEIKTLALQLIDIASLYQHCRLDLDEIEFVDLRPLVRLLNPEEIVTSSFYIYECYSSELQKIRQDKRRLEQQIIASDQADEKESLRKQRSGVIALEKRAEFKVRQQLTAKLGEWLDQIRQSLLALTRLEMLLARAVLARRWPSCRPEFTADSGSLMIVEAINPETAVVLEAAGKQFCPVSIELKPGVTILTGANMGGKTVAMLTVAFNAQLARLGFYPFARRLKLPAFAFINFVGGDSQNQQAGLSSFGAEIINLGQVAASIKSGVGLALFDEFARSTNPCEGRRFVQALCEFLQCHKTVGLVATHYDGIDLSAAEFYQVVGLKNADSSTLPQVSGDPQAILNRLCANMDYRLQKVEGKYRVPQDALKIAGLLEADPDFMKILKKFYD